MKKVAEGDTIRVHYTGKLDDGSVFDSSEGRDPLEFTVGSGKLIKGFDTAVRGMSQGESTEVNIPAAEAYGAPREELKLKVERDKFPPHIELEAGIVLNIPQPDGSAFQARVAELTDEYAVLDGNHPLAGKDLTFNITVDSFV